MSEPSPCSRAKNLRRIGPVLLLATLPGLLSCGREKAEEIPVYRQAAPAAPKVAAQAKPAAPVTGLPPAAASSPPPSVAWTKPERWGDAPASAMRTASFAVPSAGDAGEADCSIIRLAGEAGGIAKNVNRWRGQLGLEPQAPAAIMAAVESQTTAGGLAATMVGLIVGADKTPGAGQAILAAIIPQGGGTLFVKLWGPRATVAGASEEFGGLVNSLRPEAAAGCCDKPGEHTEH